MKFDETNMKVYAEHPVSKEDENYLRGRGYEILDIKFAPKEETGKDVPDMEDEDASSDNTETIIHPFKPNEIEIEIPPFTVGYLMDKIEHEEINMNTDFQREGNLWSPEKQSRLIESILLGLPLPAFYFDTFSPAWDIIDGLQRCWSIKNFCVKKTLSLTGLEYLKLDGKKFDDLDRASQRSIITRPITVNLLKKSPRNVRYILFKRLNTDGLVLTPQEIRNAIYQGNATKGLKELSEMPEFLDATLGKIPTKRMQNRDYVCRFIAFYLTDYTEYAPDLDSFLNSSMELLEEKDIEPIKQNFRKALLLAIDIFGADAFRKRIDKTATRRPINKAYFEVITVNFSKLNDDEEILLRQKTELLKDNLIELLKNKRYNNSLSLGTGTKDSVNIRFSWFNQVLKKSINGQKIRIGDDNKIEVI